MPWIAVPPLSIPTLPSGLSAGGVNYLGDSVRFVGVKNATPTDPADGGAQPNSNDIDKAVWYESLTEKWIMATIKTFGYSGSQARFGIVAGAYFLQIQATEINGYAWFSDGSRKVYKSVGYGWVYTSTLAAGVEPREWYDDDLSAYQGDAFWAGATILTSLTPRGSYRDDGLTAAITTADYTLDYERWESDTQYNAYTAAGGATGTRYFGNATWTDGDGGTWTQRSAYRDATKAKDIHRPFSYFIGPELLLKWDATASAYVVGTYGDGLGWWQNASAPVAGVAYTITFTVPAGSSVTGSDIELTPSSYVDGDWIPTKAAIYALDWAVMV